MTFTFFAANQTTVWIQKVHCSLRAFGYYYEPKFCRNVENAEEFVATANQLGNVYVPSGAESAQPFIPTKPLAAAPRWRPFDRQVPIRWHNDFSTRAGRPQLSLSWILRQDPNGPDHGAWWVASSAAVIAKLCESREGKRLVADLRERAHPFGYRDAGSWRQFRVIVKGSSSPGAELLRFYGPALEDGAWLRFGKVPERTKDIVARIEEAANAVRVVLPAKTGSLLIVHNGLCLHDRSPQTVTGPKELRRQALLCFVRRVHQPL
jgi:Taurine catabolism dioxygenase TauD, TfdA family